MFDKKQKLFHIFVALALLLGAMAPIVASGRLFQVRGDSNLTQMAGQTLQTLAPAGLAEEAVSWNSGVFGYPELLAVSWNSGVIDSQQFLAVSWNSGISVYVSWNS